MAVEPARFARARALQALRSRDFRLLWSGQTVSLIGDGAFIIALGWRTTQLTGRSGAFALVLMLHGLALLTTLLIGGALADRHSRRLMMIGSDLVRCAVIGALAVTDATGHLSLPLLLGFAVAFGLGDGFFYPAFGGIVPLVVDRHELASANTLIAASRQGAFFVGPSLAGSIYGLAGPSAVFGFDAGTFVVSALLLALARPRPFEPEEHAGTFESIRDGVRYVAGVPWLWIGIGVSAFVLMVAMAPFNALLPRFVQQEYHRGVGSYGLFFSLLSAGMLLGTLVFGQVSPGRRRLAQFFGSLALNDLLMVAATLTHSYGAALGLMVARGLLIGYGIACWSTLVMEQVPESKLSRVTSLDFFGSTGLVPLGYALTALIAPLAKPSTILLVGFSLAFVLWGSPLLVRRVREAA
jgi:MFS family permease